MSPSWEGRINKIGRSLWKVAGSLRNGVVRKQCAGDRGSCSYRWMRFSQGSGLRGGEGGVEGWGGGSTEGKD